MTRSHASLGALAELPPPFSIAVESHGEAATVRPRGELDLATIDHLRHALERLIEARTTWIVVDLGEVEFLDSTGLHVLLRIHARSQRDGWVLKIIPGPPAVQRIFDITCTTDRLPFAGSTGRAANG